MVDVVALVFMLVGMKVWVVEPSPFWDMGGAIAFSFGVQLLIRTIIRRESDRA